MSSDCLCNAGTQKGWGWVLNTSQSRIWLSSKLNSRVFFFFEKWLKRAPNLEETCVLLRGGNQSNLIGKDFPLNNFLAMKFTARMLYYYS
jgi:hypothetical protein